jgi:hypothetical protein
VTLVQAFDNHAMHVIPVENLGVAYIGRQDTRLIVPCVYVGPADYSHLTIPPASVAGGDAIRAVYGCQVVMATYRLLQAMFRDVMVEVVIMGTDTHMRLDYRFAKLPRNGRKAADAGIYIHDVRSSVSVVIPWPSVLKTVDNLAPYRSAFVYSVEKRGLVPVSAAQYKTEMTATVHDAMTRCLLFVAMRIIHPPCQNILDRIAARAVAASV